MSRGSELSYRSYYRESWNVLKKNPAAMFCLLIVIELTLIAVFAPVIAPYDSDKTELANKLLEPSLEHPFGCDELGRDDLRLGGLYPFQHLLQPAPRRLHHHHGHCFQPAGRRPAV